MQLSGIHTAEIDEPAERASGRLSRQLGVLAGLALLAAVLFVFAALATWNVTDPSLSSANGRLPQNAGGFVDFSGTNLTQLNVRLGFEPADEYFFVGDSEWGVSVGYDLEDTAEILIPFSGSVKLEVVVDNRAFARIYAFGDRHILAEAGFRVDGLEWSAQWWGGDNGGSRRRRRTTSPNPAATSPLLNLPASLSPSPAYAHLSHRIRHALTPSRGGGGGVRLYEVRRELHCDADLAGMGEV